MGQEAEAASFDHRLAAVVGGDGKIVRGYKISAVERKGPGDYVVTWGTNLVGGGVHSNFVATVGAATTEATVKPGVATVGVVANETNKSWVRVYDLSGNPLDATFHIFVGRDH
jgi:hypothetical protein